MRGPGSRPGTSTGGDRRAWRPTPPPATQGWRGWDHGGADAEAAFVDRRAQPAAQHLDRQGMHQPFYTLEELQQASPTGEVFINGQHAATNRPKAIARSFVQVAPQPHSPSDWDWYQGFPVGSDLGPLTVIPGC